MPSVLFPALMAGALRIPSLLPAGFASDTIVARTLPQRDLLAWVAGSLEVAVLVLLVVVLVGIVALLLSMRGAIRQASAALDQFVQSSRPLLADAHATMTEVHGMVRQVRADVERLSGVAGTVGDQLHAASHAVADRLEALGETLDLLQGELDRAVRTVAVTLRGLRALLRGVVPGRRRRRSRGAEGATREERGRSTRASREEAPPER